MTFVKNPYLDDIMEVFGRSKPPHRFTLDAEYDTDTRVVHFVVYADQWHRIPDAVLPSCAEWLNQGLTILRDRGIVVSLEKRDDIP